MNANDIAVGTPVEVSTVFAHGEEPQWRGGYVLVGSGHVTNRGELLSQTTRDSLLVAHTSGMLAGVSVRYDRRSVRAA